MNKKSSSNIVQAKETIKDLVINEKFHTLFLAVSGGLDSVALLNLCLDVKREANRHEKVLTDVDLIVLHFNHKLRGSDSEADEEAVRAICMEKGLTLFVGKADVAELANEEGISVELAARKARYAFFTEKVSEVLGKGVDQGVLCTAHHLYDQSESILLHLLRGTGLAGLEGMRSLAYFDKLGIWISRPLLNLAKEEIISYAKEKNLSWREDTSNQESDYTRNFLRLEILPRIRERINEQVDGSLSRLSQIVQDENDYFDGEVRKLHDRWQKKIADRNFASKRNAHFLKAKLINREDFLAESVAIQRRYLRFFLKDIMGLEGEISFQDIEETRDLFLRKANKKKVLYDIIVLSDYESLLFYRKRDDHSTVKEKITITLPEREGESLFFSWPRLGMEFSISLCHLDLRVDKINPSKAYCTLAAQGLNRLQITTYQGGEGFSQFGGTSKPLGKRFNDWKLSAELREEWPIFVADDEVVWLPGLGRSDERLLQGKGQVYIIEWVNPEFT